ncbi:hypothetical protein D7Z54_02190 [Salibacterium salarium]|uniref:Uncharacterized protein n=1 Tax=Salibacterium salarium TaxID=284579 RepID=A0A428NAJ6_9BACI|nr:hypothetical protein [Salibacterium salarium]RSL35395.1 hypothetical protein D7Z54_02190 [Salibacterium salarium]
MHPDSYAFHMRNLHDQSRQYMYHDVVLTMNDGSTYNGIIEDVGTERMSVLVAEDVMEREDEFDGDDRQFFGGGGYGRPRRRFRRYRRRNFPLASLAALALLPYVSPYPYYPYYPYY